jgi:hypothetical protein
MIILRCRYVFVRLSNCEGSGIALLGSSSRLVYNAGMVTIIFCWREIRILSSFAPPQRSQRS